MGLVMTTTDVSVTTTSQQHVATDSERKYLRVQNKDLAASVYVKTQSAHSGTEGIELKPNGVWEPEVPPNDAVFMKSSAGTVTVSIVKA